MTDLLAAIDYWREHPVEAVKDWFQVTPEDYQGDALTELFRHGRVSMKSAHGVGKTNTMAWAGWIYLITRPLCKVPCTAPTANQLMDILWPEFGKWHIRMPAEFQDQFTSSATHIRHKKYNNWFATARTSNKPENMQGFHEDNILILVDEASGILQNIFEVIEGIMSSADEEGKEALILMAGNPTQTSGEFHASFNKNRELYSRFTVSGDDTTKFQKADGRTYISKRVSEKYREVMLKKYGDGPVYDVRVRGLFPRDADDVVIPLSWAEAAQFVDLPPFDLASDPVTMVMDVARFGGNKTTLGLYRKGHCIGMHHWVRTSTNRCADILDEAFHHGGYGMGDLRRGAVIIDEPGVGGGVIDVARRMNIPIVPYNGSAALVKGIDPEEHFRMFSNRRSRDWWLLRRNLEQSLSKIPENEDIVNELASVKYAYVNEKIKVESKRDMIERLGEDASPDFADNIVMGLSPYMGVTSTQRFDGPIDVHYGFDRPTAEMDFGYGETPWN